MTATFYFMFLTDLTLLGFMNHHGRGVGNYCADLPHCAIQMFGSGEVYIQIPSLYGFISDGIFFYISKYVHLLK